MKKQLSGIVFLFITVCCFAKPAVINNADDLNQQGLIFGCPLGSASQLFFEEQYPDIAVQYLDIDVGLLSIQQGKINGIVADTSLLEYSVKLNNVTGIKFIEPENAPEIIIAGGISRKTKIPQLKEKYDEFIQLITADGTLEDMYNYWILEAKAEKRPVEKASNPVGTLTVGTTGSAPPFSYYNGTDLVGIDIELNERFALWLGYDLEFKTYDFVGIVSAASAGVIDAIFSNFNWTAERAEAVDYTIPYVVSTVAAVVRSDADDAEGTTSFISRLKDSFIKDFIKENRWKLVISGLEVTIVISLCSLVFGLLLGFGLCMLRRSGNKTLNVCCITFIRLLQGLPTVVLLLILYYLIFASSSISGVVVAIIGFSLNFAAYASESMRSGMEGIDKGQIEAARALGYSRTQTFWKIIFPQAAVNFIPILKGDFISMVKMTSVVGYIAITDLTKASDIIRSRTLDAFLPLIMTAVFYFLIAWLFTQILVVLEKKVNPRQRKNILKGIEVR